MEQKQKPLKVGLLLEGYSVPAWTYRMIEKIQSSDFASIDLVVLNNNERPQENHTFLQKLTRNRGRFFYLLIRKSLEVVYAKVIQRNVYLLNASETMDCKDLLKGVHTIPVTTNRKKWSDYFYQDDLEQIKLQKPDILLRCGFEILRGEILNVAQHGIWSLHHGDNAVNRGGPPGFWESMEAWPETGAILQILSEDLDNGKVLYKSFSCANPMSVEDTKNNHYWKSILFVTRKMKELHANGADSFYAKVEENNIHPVFYSERLYTQPTNAELAKLTFKKVIDKFKLQYEQKFKIQQWSLMFHLADEFSSSLWRYKKIAPPKDRFYADPHILQRDGKYYIFIEEFPFATDKGFISVITMEEDGTYSDPVPVLETDYHLSYPFLLEYENKTYMIPESMDNDTIELYECTDFPYKWEHKVNLMENIKAVDATLFEHNSKWWLFANVVELEGVSSHDELFLFYSDSPFSTDWKAHPMNPIISDCKFARPAGELFKQGENIYRPSQNSSTRYGYGFNINKVDVLTETEYSETPVSIVEPNWDKNVLGTHTFNRKGRLHVIDALISTRK